MDAPCATCIRRGEADVDSDLADAVEGLKAIFKRRKIEAEFDKAAPELVETLKKQLRIPPRFRSFLLGANPRKVETVTPVERVRLMPAEEIASAQTQVTGDSGDKKAPLDWKSSWVVIGESSLLGDPYFLDVGKLDAEGDCPVFTMMTGTDTLKPELCASSFQQFLRILATSMEVATGFGEGVMDDDDEAIFRETLAPKIKTIDAAALRAGHWT